MTRWLSVSMVDLIPLAGIKLHGNRTGVEATSPAIRTYHPSRQGRHGFVVEVTVEPAAPSPVAQRESVFLAALSNTYQHLASSAVHRWFGEAEAASSIENWLPMTGSRAPDASSGISSVHCFPGDCGSWFHSSLVPAPITVILVSKSRFVFTTGI